ncbi:MAG: hypothetical protein WC450_12890, partial [Candidatus Omnitrophota bacterium]
MDTNLLEKNSYIKTSVDFLKSFLLYIVFAAVLVLFASVRGFASSELPVVAASFMFVLFNLLIYSYQLAAVFHKNGKTAV